MAFWKSPHAAPLQSHKFILSFGSIADKPEGAFPPFVAKSVELPKFEVVTGEYQVGNHFFKYAGPHKWNDITITVVDDKNTTRQILRELAEQGWHNPAGPKYENGPGVSEAFEAGMLGDIDYDPDNPNGNNITSATGQRGRLNNTGKLFDLSYEATSNPFGMTKRRRNKTGLIIYQQASVSTTVDRAEMSRFKDGGLGATVEGWQKGVRDFFGGINNFLRPPAPPPVMNLQHDILLNAWYLKGAFIKAVNFGTHDYSSDELITIELVISYDYAYIADYSVTAQVPDPKYKFE